MPSCSAFAFLANVARESCGRGCGAPTPVLCRKTPKRMGRLNKNNKGHALSIGILCQAQAGIERQGNLICVAHVAKCMLQVRGIHRVASHACRLQNILAVLLQTATDRRCICFGQKYLADDDLNLPYASILELACTKVGGNQECSKGEVLVSCPRRSAHESSGIEEG